MLVKYWIRWDRIIGKNSRMEKLLCWSTVSLFKNGDTIESNDGDQFNAADGRRRWCGCASGGKSNNNNRPAGGDTIAIAITYTNTTAI